MLDKAGQGEEPLGICPDTHKPVFVKIGRFGPYVQRGTADDDEKPQNASLLKGMEPEDVDLETALKLLSLPRTLGEHPQTRRAGRGPQRPLRPLRQVRRGDPLAARRTLAAGRDAWSRRWNCWRSRRSRRGGGARRKEPLKVFDASPVTGQPVRLLQGRYGPYVTDGVTNASLPRGATLEEVTFEYALNLLKERAAAGPAKRTPSAKGQSRRESRQEARRPRAENAKKA